MNASATFLPVFALGLVAWTGCAESRPSSAAADTSALRSAFATANQRFHQGLRANDTTLLVYVADDVVLMPTGEAVVRGKNAFREWYNGFLSQYQTTSMNFADQEVYVGDQWAFELGTYEWNLTPVAGGAPVTDRGNYLQLWRVQPDGQWRFAREIWNSAAPATPPAQ